MKVVSIDLETTGLNPDRCQILQVGACVFDTCDSEFKLYGQYNMYIWSETIIGEPFGVKMNAKTIENIWNYRKDYNKSIDLKCLASDFYIWLCDVLKQEGGEISINICGKNFWSFDYPFLKKVLDLDRLISFNRRSFDPAILYYDSSDAVLPDSSLCKQRAMEQGCTLFDNDLIAHDALEDAIDIAKLVWFNFNKQ